MYDIKLTLQTRTPELFPQPALRPITRRRLQVTIPVLLPVIFRTSRFTFGFVARLGFRIDASILATIARAMDPPTLLRTAGLLPIAQTWMWNKLTSANPALPTFASLGLHD